MLFDDGIVSTPVVLLLLALYISMYHSHNFIMFREFICRNEVCSKMMDVLNIRPGILL